jgi:hypothetical protein
MLGALLPAKFFCLFHRTEKPASSLEALIDTGFKYFPLKTTKTPLWLRIFLPAKFFCLLPGGEKTATPLKTYISPRRNHLPFMTAPALLRILVRTDFLSMFPLFEKLSPLFITLGDRSSKDLSILTTPSFDGRKHFRL